MLTSAYYSARAAFIEQLDYSSVPLRAVELEPVVRAKIDRGRLYGWLVLNASLSCAAIIVWAVRAMTGVRSKIVREPTLAALTMDLDAVCHHKGDGLCNAVTLNRNDRKLGRLVWEDRRGDACRRVRFVKGVKIGDSTMTSTPLVQEVIS